MNKNIKICLIENDKADYLLFKNYIEKTLGQYELDWYKDYDTALETISNDDHDLYFIDFSLGADTGLELVEEALEKGHSGPFIMLTGSDNPDLYKKFSEKGVYDYILKNELSPSLIDRCITYTLKRKKIEKDLIKEKEFVGSIIEEVPYMILGISDNKIVFANPAAIETSGFSKKELMGKNWKSLFFEDETDNLKVFIQEDGQTSFKKNIKTASGEERVVQWNVLNRHFAHNDVRKITLLLSGKDITDEIREQQEKRQKEKMESLGHLAGGVAHEINNLLLPIQLGAELVQSKLTHDEKLSQTIEKILRNSQAAAAIVEDILLFARQEKKNISKKNFSLLFHSSMEVVKSMLPPEVKLKITGLRKIEEKKCVIDEKDMVRVFTNLLLNAAHAMNNQGTITISFDIAPRNIRSGKTYESIILKIKDTGKGIDKNDLERIFEPFYTTKDVGQGTGLGLPIVYNIISSWNGNITAESTPNKGTMFKILIPTKSA